MIGCKVICEERLPFLLIITVTFLRIRMRKTFLVDCIYVQYLNRILSYETRKSGYTVPYGPIRAGISLDCAREMRIWMHTGTVYTVWWWN